MGNGFVKSSLAAMVITALFFACASQDDGEKIAELIAQGAASAERHDIAGVLALATGDVRAMPMDLDRRGINAVLWQTFNYYGPLKILYPRPAVEINGSGNDAIVQFPFLIVKKGQLFPDLESLRDEPLAWIAAIGATADLYRLRMQLTRQGGDWLVYRAMLERFTGVGFE